MGTKTLLHININGTKACSYEQGGPVKVPPPISISYISGIAFMRGGPSRFTGISLEQGKISPSWAHMNTLSRPAL